MGLVRAVQQGITRVNIQAQSDTAIAATGLGISAAAMKAVGSQNNLDRQNLQTLARGVQAVRNPTQTNMRDLGSRIGTTLREAKLMTQIEKPFVAACKATVVSAKSKANMFQVAASAGQAVAQINSAAQHQISEGHVEASFNTAISQAAAKIAI